MILKTNLFEGITEIIKKFTKKIVYIVIDI